METLEDIIKEKTQWKRLREYTSEFNQEIIGNNQNKIIDICKSMIESVLNTILEDKKLDYDISDAINQKVKKVFESLKLFKDDISIDNKDQESIKQIINAITTIVKNMGELRNRHGFISHGIDLHSNQIFEKETIEFLIEISLALTKLLIKVHDKDKVGSKRKHYDNFVEFNNWVDSQEEAPTSCGIEVKASEFLFKFDPIAYMDKYEEFLNENKEIVKEFEGENWKNYDLEILIERVQFLESEELDRVICYIITNRNTEFRPLVEEIIDKSSLNNSHKIKLEEIYLEKIVEE